MSADRQATELAGRRALVTGGGSGIGAACARRLAGAGADVLVLDVVAERAQAIAAEIGGEAIVADLASPVDLESLCDGPVQGIDVLVNNAGVQHVAPIEHFPVERFSTILAIMLEAPFRLTRAALPHMYEQGWGRIVNMSSVHGLVASPGKTAYVAAKHGLQGLTKVVALEGGARGVTCNAVCPGGVRTELAEQQVRDASQSRGVPEERVVEDLLAQSAIKRLMDPADVAEVVAFLCSGAGAFMNGSSYTIDGGWTAR